MEVAEVEGTEFVVSGSTDASVIKWKLEKNMDTCNRRISGTPEIVYKEHSGPVNDLSIILSGNNILSASDDKTKLPYIQHCRKRDFEAVSEVRHCDYFM